MLIKIDGEEVKSDFQFHVIIEDRLKIAPYYGRNLSALWDTFNINVERPVIIVWEKFKTSRDHMPNFDKIINIFKDLDSSEVVEKGDCLTIRLR